MLQPKKIKKKNKGQLVFRQKKTSYYTRLNHVIDLNSKYDFYLEPDAYTLILMRRQENQRVLWQLICKLFDAVVPDKDNNPFDLQGL